MNLSHSFIIEPEAALEKQWDVIIIGSGMGGASAAYQLTKQNKKVLLIEKGLANFGLFKGVETEESDPQERLNSGKWPTKITACINDRKSDIWAPLGCGAGGSSLLYAAALQRLRPEDLMEQTLPDGSIIKWPFDYEELAPYYQQAETLFSVCGTTDPLESGEPSTLLPPPAMCDVDQHFFQQFQAVGLHPHRLHVGIKYDNPCAECGGHICQKSCKQDANNACLQPALLTGNLSLIEAAEVLRLNARPDQITSITIKHKDNEYELAASIFVLAAGAYFSPVILQNSKNNDWPDGLANKSGMVGRNLMFHASDFIALWPKHKLSRQGPKKTIALRDYYRFNNRNLGEFQSTGLAAGYGNIVYALRLMFDQSKLKKLSFLRHFLRFPAYIAAKILGEATIYTTIVEDYPYKDNRIVADKNTPSGMRFEYHIHDEFKERVLFFKNIIRKRLSNIKSLPMATGINLNYGHPCGTCKAGEDPADSVLDKNCKAHGLNNLYIADASFMPTSGGTNPSLTIAANALRVADKINKQLHDNR